MAKAQRSILRELRQGQDLPRLTLAEVVAGKSGVARTNGSGSLICWRDNDGQGFMLAKDGPRAVGDMTQLVPDGIRSVAPSYQCGLGGNGCYESQPRPAP